MKVHLHHFSKIKSPKVVTKQCESRFFLLYLLADRRIRIRGQSRIRIHTSDEWIRIREVQKQMDPVDPNPALMAYKQPCIESILYHQFEIKTDLAQSILGFASKLTPLSTKKNNYHLCPGPLLRLF